MTDALAKIVRDTVQAVPEVVDYLSPSALAYLRVRGVTKADGGDLGAINKTYHDAITRALVSYFEGGGIGASRNKFKREMIQAFGDAFDSGWTDAGAELPIEDEDALGWLEARLNQEAGYIDMLFQEAKELRKEGEFDYFAWITERADGYTNTLKEIYNNGRVRVMENVMVIFDGDDGTNSCATCRKLKGKRHKLSWFIARNYIPPHGSGLDCSKGGRCQHGLRKDDGEWITI